MTLREHLCLELLDTQFSGDEHNCAYLPRHVMHNLGARPVWEGLQELSASPSRISNCAYLQLSRMAAM